MKRAASIAFGLINCVVAVLSFMHPRPAARAQSDSFRQYAFSCGADGWVEEVKKANERGLTVDMGRCLALGEKIVCVADEPAQEESSGK